MHDEYDERYGHHGSEGAGNDTAYDDADSDNIYDEETRENLLEHDLLTVEEEGFMKGYESDIDEGK